MNTKILLSLTAFAFLLNGCAPMAVSAGAATGVAATQEGGLSRAAGDLRIQAEINDFWFQKDFAMFSKLDLTVNEGRVLITGVVQNPEHRVEAVRLAWKPKGVKQVINEIKVAKSEGITGYAKDTWITTRLRAIILMDSEIESVNYSIDTVQGTVYLMGFANSQPELERVIQKARTIENVKQVVSYVRVAGMPDAPLPPASATAPPGAGQGYSAASPAPYNSTYNPPVAQGAPGSAYAAPAPIYQEPLPDASAGYGGGSLQPAYDSQPAYASPSSGYGAPSPPPADSAYPPQPAYNQAPYDSAPPSQQSQPSYGGQLAPYNQQQQSQPPAWDQRSIYE